MKPHTYLKTILTDAQYAAFRIACQHDQRDSEARRRWRYIETWQHESQYPRLVHIAHTHLAWLKLHGYADESGKRVGP